MALSLLLVLLSHSFAQTNDLQVPICIGGFMKDFTLEAGQILLVCTYV